MSQPRQAGESSRSRGTLGGARKDRFSRNKGKGRSAYEYVFMTSYSFFRHKLTSRKEKPKDEGNAKEAVTQFRPRSQIKTSAASSSQGQEYKDRAAMRRQGDGGEYKHVSFRVNSKS